MSRNKIIVLIYHGHKLLDLTYVYHASINYMAEANFLIYKPVLMTGNITHTRAVHKIELISKGAKTRCGHNKFLFMLIDIPFLFCL
jgi:hypothetical protein